MIQSLFFVVSIAFKMAAVIYEPSIELSLKHVEHQLCRPAGKKTGTGVQNFDPVAKRFQRK